MNRYIVVTHNRVYGIPDALRDYLVEKKFEKVVFIAHPLDKVSGDSFMQLFLKGKKVKEERVKRSESLGSFNFILDSLLTLYWVIFKNSSFDIYVGCNNLNAFSGILLRILGKVDKSIFYAIDFSQDRLKNKFLNVIYSWIDKFSIYNSDQLWNVSLGISYARKQYLGIDPNNHPQKLVPTGVWNGIVKPLPFEKIKKHQLFFIGHLLEKQGVQLVLEAIPTIIKQIPNFKFVVVGGGEYKEELEKLSSKLNINNYVEFTGIIQDHHDVHKIMRESAVGIALYKPEQDKTKNFTYFGDPGKIKDYLNMGLPVILTDVSYNAKDLEKYGCAVVIPYTKESVVKAVIKIMKNTNNLKRYRKKAQEKAKEFDWHKIFDNALS